MDNPLLFFFKKKQPSLIMKKSNQMGTFREAMICPLNTVIFITLDSSCFRNSVLFGESQIINIKPDILLIMALLCTVLNWIIQTPVWKRLFNITFKDLYLRAQV